MYFCFVESKKSKKLEAVAYFLVFCLFFLLSYFLHIGINVLALTVSAFLNGGRSFVDLEVLCLLVS